MERDFSSPNGAPHWSHCGTTHQVRGTTPMVSRTFLASLGLLAPRSTDQMKKSSRSPRGPSPSLTHARESIARWASVQRELWEERAAIMEFDGGIRRIDAEQQAFALLAERARSPSPMRIH